MKSSNQKVPMRKCVGCEEMKNKKEMMRVLKTEDGEFVIDTTGKKNGRGAYVCKSLQCLKKARKAGRIEKNLECAISDEIYAQLEEEITSDEQ